MLRLDLASTFWARLGGLHLRPRLQGQQGLCLIPCNAVHTLGLTYAIDVVFLDQQWQELTRIIALKPNRVAVCKNARLVVELPANYCCYHPDYLDRIHLALAAITSASGTCD